MKPTDKGVKDGNVKNRSTFGMRAGTSMHGARVQPRKLPYQKSYSVKSPTTKSLLKFRHRQEQQKLMKAQQYKSYQRMMKREGYELSNSQKIVSNSNVMSDDGGCKIDASTNALTEYPEMKPQSDHTSIDTSSNPDKKSDDITAEQQAQINHQQKKHRASDTGNGKSTKMQLQNHQQRKNQKQCQESKEMESLERQRRIEHEKKTKFKERQQRHKLLSARTSKGQPIMNNIVQDILRKLQNEKTNET
jgi:rRNA processing